MSTQFPSQRTPFRPNRPRLLFWACLAAGVSVFVGLTIVLVVICLRSDDADPVNGLAHTPPLHIEPRPAQPAQPAQASTTKAITAPVNALIKKGVATPRPAKEKAPPPSSVVSPPQLTKTAPLQPAALAPTTMPDPARGWAKRSALDGHFPDATQKQRAVEAQKAGLIPASPAAKAAFFEYPLNDPPVNRAIARGVAFLKRADDFRIGGKALAGLTLLSCGVSPRDAAVVRFAKEVRAGLPLTATYELALCLLLLDRLGHREDKDLIRRIALQLMAGQGMQGGWNYHCAVLTSKQEKKLLALLQAPVRRVSGKQTFSPRIVTGPGVPPDLRDLPAVHYRPGQQFRFQPTQWHEDNSLTQFVILALWRAQKHGVPVERALAMVEARFRASQNPDGSWGYKWANGFLGGSFRADSMTCAGLLGLAVGRAVEPTDLAARSLPARAPRAKSMPKKPARQQEGDPAIEKALLFLSQKIGAPAINDAVAEQMKANAMFMNLQMQLAQAPPAQRPFIMQRLQAMVKINNRLKARGTILGANARGDLYYLWSLERVAVAYDLQTIGGKDWYAWGAPLIVAHQQADGSWADLYPGVPDTCFALLFLKRVNVARDLTLSLQRLTLSREVAGRMHDLSIGGSPGERMQMSQPKGPPLRTRD